MCIRAKHLMLRLSHEHSGFTFEKDFHNAAKLIEKHSGGKCSKALLMYLDCNRDKLKSDYKWITDNVNAVEKDKEVKSAAVTVENKVVEKAPPVTIVDDEMPSIRQDVYIPQKPKKKGLFSCWFC